MGLELRGSGLYDFRAVGWLGVVFGIIRVSILSILIIVNARLLSLRGVSKSVISRGVSPYNLGYLWLYLQPTY